MSSNQAEDSGPRWASKWGDSTNRLYAGKGIGQRSGFGSKPALLVVDMAVAFCDPSTPVGSNMDDTLERIASLLEAVRRHSLLTVFTTTAYSPDYRDLGVWGLKAPALKSLLIGDPLTEIHPRIAPIEGDYLITKKFASAFFATNLTALLISQHVDSIILTGCSTSGCIRATAIDSVSYGYRTVVPEECVADRAPGPHEANLFDINAKYADVLPLDEVLDYVGGLSRR